MTLVTLNEKEIVCTLLALALLLFFAFMIGTLFEEIKAPRVVGEIVGGILLGGTCLYAINPDFIGGFLWHMSRREKYLIFFIS